jgi:hypothetical protein
MGKSTVESKQNRKTFTSVYITEGLRVHNKQMEKDVTCETCHRISRSSEVTGTF